MADYATDPSLIKIVIPLVLGDDHDRVSLDHLVLGFSRGDRDTSKRKSIVEKN